MKIKKYLILSALLVAVLSLGAFTLASAQAGKEGYFRGGQRGGMMQPGVFGKVVAINGNSITMTGIKNNITYSVDASSATVTKNGASSTVSAIAVGDTIAVSGTVTGINIVAKTIRDGMMPKQPGNQPIIQGNGLPVIAGAVNAINGNILTVANKSITYTVDVTSATITKNGQASTVSGITVGDNVVVQGTVNGNNVSATSVIDQAKPANASGNVMPKKNPGFFGGMMNFFKGLFGF